ncbi:uncharacterized protein METZ01_LOCUS153793 [marine metagenome]|uniref:Uncharacterized protein n=1 Tax=marine metagenome TaxID=408172 RepID=A0A382AHT3_9ZZZZ
MYKIMFSLCVITFLSSCGMNIKPTNTTVTYGETTTTNDTAKDAKNDSTTTSDSDKKTWSIKQSFKWGNND